MRQLFTESGTFDAEAYWATREIKKFVVYLETGKGRRRKLDSVLVSAKNEKRRHRMREAFHVDEGQNLRYRSAG